eukprot:641236-Amphidinium_carterae.1
MFVRNAATIISSRSLQGSALSALCSGTFYYGAFHFFIAFTFLAVVNIVTGLFVDNVMRASQGDIQETVLCSLEDMVAFEQSASALFTVMDKDHDGYLLKDSSKKRVPPL